MANREAAKKILESVGFSLTSDLRHWYHEELAIPIEIPDHTLAGSLDKVIEIKVEEGFSVYVIGVEDLILDRARSALYWGYSQDRHWALSILAAQYTSIDFDYLKKVSAREDEALFKLINELIDEAQKIINKI